MVGDNPYSFLHVDKAEIDLDESIDLYDERVYARARSNLDKMVAEGSLFRTRPRPVYLSTETGAAYTDRFGGLPFHR